MRHVTQLGWTVSSQHIKNVVQLAFGYEDCISACSMRQRYALYNRIVSLDVSHHLHVSAVNIQAIKLAA
jgi:hypothetical protein